MAVLPGTFCSGHLAFPQPTAAKSYCGYFGWHRRLGVALTAHLIRWVPLDEAAVPCGQQEGGDGVRKLTNTGLLAGCFLLVVTLLLTWTPASVHGESCPQAGHLGELNQRLQGALANEAWAEAAELLESLQRFLWSEVPLTVRNVYHVSRSPGFFGDVVQRPDTHYVSGDTLRVYAEPQHYHFDCRGAVFMMHLVLDVKIIYDGTRIVFHDPEFLRYRVGGIHPAREFFVDLSFELGPGIPPGPYVLALELTDRISGNTAVAETAFTFEH